jgi:hypothetical protein
MCRDKPACVSVRACSGLVRVDQGEEKAQPLCRGGPRSVLGPRIYLKRLLAIFSEAKDFKGKTLIMPTSLKAITATALIGIGTLSLSPPANAGWGCGWGCGWGPALAGFGVGALVGSALAAPPVYAVPPPPPDYYGPAVYGPPDYYGPAVYGPPDYDGPPAYGPPDDYGPPGYGPPDYDGPMVNGAPPRTPSWYGNRQYPRSTTPPRAAADGQRPGPTLSTTAKAGVLTSSAQKTEVKFKAAQAKAKRGGVDTLTKEDIEGLSSEQIKQLRGY